MFTSHYYEAVRLTKSTENAFNHFSVLWTETYEYRFHMKPGKSNPGSKKCTV